MVDSSASELTVCFEVSSVRYSLFQLPTHTPTSRPSRCRMNTAQVTAKQIA